MSRCASTSTQFRPGVLVGIGVGPGDPELMTLKSARLISEAAVVTFPLSPGGASLARSIAAGFIRPGTQEIAAEVPMCRDRLPAQKAYDGWAEQIASHLDAGTDVICLCEGDPLVFGSFMYLHARLSPRYPVSVVPGVSSINAGAAVAGMPLAARNEILSILPASLPDDVLRARLADCSGAVFIKVGRHLPRIRALIEAEGLSSQARYIERATMAGERVLTLGEAPHDAPYFSMILVAKGTDPWL